MSEKEEQVRVDSWTPSELLKHLYRGQQEMKEIMKGTNERLHSLENENLKLRQSLKVLKAVGALITVVISTAVGVVAFFKGVAS